MIKGALAREFLWAAPFLCVGFAVLGLLQPVPSASVNSGSRLVLSADGMRIRVEKPFRGVVLTWCAFGPGGYLENTRSPETLQMAGGQEEREWFGKYSFMSRVYPEVWREDRFWDRKNGDLAVKDKTGVEGLLTYNAGAYIGDCGAFGMIPLLRAMGLPAIFINWHEKNGDEGNINLARVENSVAGHPEMGEELIAIYQQSFSALKNELKQDTRAKTASADDGKLGHRLELLLSEIGAERVSVLLSARGY